MLKALAHTIPYAKRKINQTTNSTMTLKKDKDLANNPCSALAISVGSFNQQVAWVFFSY